MRINVGCGQMPTKGWRNFDNSFSLRLARLPILPTLLLRLRLLDDNQFQFIQFARENAIEYGDATRSLPIPSSSVDVLYSSHMFEHLDRREAVLFLKEAMRVLRSGGTIRLAVPDIQRQARQYIATGDADAFIEATLLTQDRPRSFSQRLKLLLVGTRHHQWMYDGRSLLRLLESEGFASATVLEPGESRIEDPQDLNLRERSSESVYLEAIKP